MKHIAYKLKPGKRGQYDFNKKVINIIQNRRHLTSNTHREEGVFSVQLMRAKVLKFNEIRGAHKSKNKVCKKYIFFFLWQLLADIKSWEYCVTHN